MNARGCYNLPMSWLDDLIDLFRDDILRGIIQRIHNRWGNIGCLTLLLIAMIIGIAFFYIF